MHFFWTVGLRSSTSSRCLLFKRLQSTQTTAPSAKSLFTYGKGGHYFFDRIDPDESVRITQRLDLGDCNSLCLIEIFQDSHCESW